MSGIRGTASDGRKEQDSNEGIWGGVTFTVLERFPTRKVLFELPDLFSSSLNLVLEGLINRDPSVDHDIFCDFL